MLGGGLNYLGSCSKGRSMLRQLHIAQSLFGESNDFGVFREEMGDGFEQGGVSSVPFGVPFRLPVLF